MKLRLELMRTAFKVLVWHETHMAPAHDSKKRDYLRTFSRLPCIAIGHVGFVWADRDQVKLLSYLLECAHKDQQRNGA